MADREQFRSCMSDAMTGKTYTKEERKLAFCVSAKLCSGKSTSKEEAIEICKNRPPKEPKERKVRTPKQCNARMLKLARCVTGIIDIAQITNPAAVEQILTDALLKCECNKV